MRVRDAGAENQPPIFNSYTYGNQPPISSGVGRAGPFTTGLKSGSENRLRYLCTELRLSQTVSKWMYWPPFAVTKGRTFSEMRG